MRGPPVVLQPYAHGIYKACAMWHIGVWLGMGCRTWERLYMGPGTERYRSGRPGAVRKGRKYQVWGEAVLEWDGAAPWGPMPGREG